MPDFKLLESFQVGNVTADVSPDRSVEMVTLAIDGKRPRAMILAMAKDLYMELREAIETAEARLSGEEG